MLFSAFISGHSRGERLKAQNERGYGEEKYGCGEEKKGCGEEKKGCGEEKKRGCGEEKKGGAEKRNCTLGPLYSFFYCGQSTASEVFLVFTTQLYSYVCNYHVIFFIYWQEGSIATGILPTPNTSLTSLPVGSKLTIREYRNKNTSLAPTIPSRHPQWVVIQ